MKNYKASLCSMGLIVHDVPDDSFALALQLSRVFNFWSLVDQQAAMLRKIPPTLADLVAWRRQKQFLVYHRLAFDNSYLNVAGHVHGPVMRTCSCTSLLASHFALGLSAAMA